MAYDYPETLTHSKISQASCLARYHKLHVLGLADTSDPARRGSTVHTANELYLQALVQAGQPSDFELADACLHDAIVQERTPAHLIPDCEYLWQNHVEAFELDLDAFLEAEKRRTVGAFSFKPDLAYVYPDRLELHDLKTHYQALSEDGAKRDLQARMYVWLASQVWQGFDRYRFVFRFVRLNHLVVADFQPSELDAIGRQMAAHAESLADAAAKDEWPAMPGQQCQYCTFACDIVDHALRTPARILTREDAITQAGHLVVLKAAIAQQQRVLEQYTALNGPVEAAEHRFGHEPYTRSSYPAAPVLDLLRDHGAPVERLDFGSTALRTFLTTKKWAYLVPDLQAMEKQKTGTRFMIKKLAGEDEPAADEA